MLGTDEIGTASLLVMASAALLVYGIKQSTCVAGLCTALELLGLAIIIAVGLPRLGTIDNFETAAERHAGISTAAALIFFAYIGFEEIVQLAEETRERRYRNTCLACCPPRFPARRDDPPTGG